jgi:hypothetical protein
MLTLEVFTPKPITHTLAKCNLNMALIWCIADFSDLIKTFSHSQQKNSSFHVSEALQCRATCVECIEGFESSTVYVRGLLVQAVIHSCDSFLNECELLPNPAIQRCIESCRRCMKACYEMVADHDFSTFFSS